MEVKNRGRTLAIGDIHGNYKAFQQCLERSQFDNDVDTLISLGDVVDGHCESFEVVEKLLEIKNLITIKGNHDDWFNMWIETGNNPSGWLQGQKATGDSYVRNLIDENLDLYDYSTGTKRVRLTTAHLPQTHIEFFKNQLHYYIDDNNNIFVHGGFNRHYPIEEQDDILWWDRDLWSQALSYGNISAVEGIQRPRFKMVGDYKKVFIGHTPTQFWDVHTPMNAANVWNLDTGGGFFGKVSIMDVNTKEFWQSDTGKELYPEFKGR